MELDPREAFRSPFLAGAVGALITAVRFTPGATWWERGFNVCAGSVTAGFVTPALIEWLHLTSPTYLSATAFFLGLLGMSLAASLMQALKETPFGQILTGWITRR